MILILPYIQMCIKMIYLTLGNSKYILVLTIQEYFK